MSAAVDFLPLVLPPKPFSPEALRDEVSSLSSAAHQGCESGPCIQAANAALCYTPNIDSRFQDRDSFALSSARFVEGAARQEKLLEILESGEQFAGLLYTWRSCAGAMVDVKSDEENVKKEITEEKVALLQPLVNKLFTLMKFQKSAMETFCMEIKRLIYGSAEKQKDNVINDTLLLTLGKFIHMFATLDELKNIKSSIHNDYTVYKRAEQTLNRTVDPRMFQESQELSVFLANRNVMRNTLKSKLSSIEGIEEFLCKFINFYVEMFDENRYVLPPERHSYVSIIAFSVYLIDQVDSPLNINKLDSKRKLNLNKIDKIFKEIENIPVYGDVSISPFKIVQECPNFDVGKWTHCSSSSRSPQANLLPKMASIRSDHATYVCELRELDSLIESDTSEEDDEKLYTAVLKGLKLLSAWTCRVTETFSWKCANLADSRTNPACREDASVYERATLYNYSTEEKHALIELVAMIKGLQVLLKNKETEYMSAIKRYIYRQLQKFTLLDLREPHRKSVKHKKPVLTSLLQSIRDTISDCPEAEDDPALLGKKGEFHVTVKQKAVPPSHTQVYLVRTMVEHLLVSGGKKSLRKDVEEKCIPVMESFHQQSFFWQYMLHLDKTLQKCCDLSQLWYREYYLDLAKEIQFPTSVSMPWILADSTLEMQNSSSIEYALHILDLYNDSADFALRQFRAQYLYQEVEAEVILCFEQFVYKLSQSIFLQSKEQALCVLLGSQFFHPPFNRYSSILKQREVELLGRTINLNSVISERVSKYLRKSLDAAISKFESGDITGIVELDGLIHLHRLTHRFLAYNLTLPDFDFILAEVVHGTSSIPQGRIAAHVLLEIYQDFVPNYCFNSATNRFVRTKYVINSTEVDRMEVNKKEVENLWSTKKAPGTNTSYNNVFDIIYSKYSCFVGLPHLRALCGILGYEGIGFVMQELVNLMKNVIEVPLTKSVKTLSTALPGKCKLPRYEYTSVGEFQYYLIQLNSILQYPDLCNVFGCFQKLGNALLLCLLLEQTLAQIESDDIKLSAAFHSIIPVPYISAKGLSAEERRNRLKEKIQEKRKEYESLNVVDVVRKLGNEEEIQVVEEIDHLARKRLCGGLEMFTKILQQVKSSLTDPIWTGKQEEAKEDMLIDVDGCAEFHRFWSSIQFSYCLPVRENEFSVEQLYGEGLQWAGCTLIKLLDQQNRFEVLDFCYHLLRVHQADQKKETVGGISLLRLVKRIRTYQFVNNQIFATLNKYLFGCGMAKQPFDDFREFAPPAPENID